MMWRDWIKGRMIDANGRNGHPQQMFLEDPEEYARRLVIMGEKRTIECQRALAKARAERVRK